ncbi:pyridoxamine 5'-phosphate oxidase family protein [Roseomonas sp. CCTCC AB2023176]|uniref:pyridoxamine 5'-phosphate oxidase family protein n=1 Tax=Roseomonas sp. CCTCC AB2023176 TaxID=3342640 RepID=UPI0035D88B0E
MASSEHEQRQKVRDMIKDVEVATLVTHHGQHLRARPMWGAMIDADGKTLWFFSKAGTEKNQEIEQNPEVLLSYSDPKAQNYVSLAGRARVVRDAAKQKELWKETMRTWFPDGPEDASITLIAVEAESAEYWDSPSSTLLHAYGYVKAVVTGQPPQGGENERVRFNA